jgi:murein DD-endopeptidase MepM/ murein hydrolase activator NlpD
MQSAFSRLLPACLLLAFATLFAPAAAAQPQAISLTPALVVAGSPELVRVNAPANATVEGEWQGHPLQFFPGHIGAAKTASAAIAWYALAGVDVEAPIGPSSLQVTIHIDNTARQLTSTIAIHPAHYQTGSITVAPKFLEPGPEELPKIEAATKAKERAFASSAGKPLWSGNFLAPVPGLSTDSFGKRRIYNGKVANVHKGADFRAATGTPVHAGNSGVVVLAQPLYFEGNCVMIDHGLGLMSISMHLSRIDVKPGQQVTRGQQIGLSGATGRVTGPHLHWAIRWQGAMLDPVKLLHMNLNQIR